MQFKISRLFFIITIILFTIFIPTKLDKVEAVEKKFTVKIVENDKQVIEKLPYFHFKGTPGKSYKVEFTVKNITNEPLNLVVKIANGFSNPYANLNDTTDSETDLSKFLDENRKFSKYVKGDKNIILQKKEEKNVSFDISVPLEMTNGEMIGAFIFEENEKMDNSEGEIDEGQSGASLKSKINYVVSTLIEMPYKVEPIMEFGSVVFQAKYAYPRIEVEIKNKKPNFLKESTLDYKILNNKNELVFQGTKEILRFGPSTNIKVPINFEGKKISPEMYTIEMTFSSNNKEFETITNKKDFEVKEEQLKSYQALQGKETIIPSIDVFGWKTYVMFGLMALLFTSLGFFLPMILKKRKKKE